MASKCRGCSKLIKWGRMNGKPHPFNLDGDSHFCYAFRGKRYLGGEADKQVVDRGRWRDRHSSVEKIADALASWDRSKLKSVPLDYELAARIARMLSKTGGPCYRRSDWGVDDITNCMYTAGVNELGQVRAISCDIALMNVLRVYCGQTQVNECYFVAGLFLVVGDWDNARRNGNWGKLGPWQLELA